MQLITQKPPQISSCHKSTACGSYLQLNQDNTEVLVIGPEGKTVKPLSKLQDFKPSQSVKNLGVIFDSELSFTSDIKNVTKQGFYHLKNIARVCPFTSQANTEVLVRAFSSCHLDYCNALLSSLPKRVSRTYNYCRTQPHVCWRGPEGGSTLRRFYNRRNGSLCVSGSI